MSEYLQGNKYVDIQRWREDFLHSDECRANRRNFWYKVVSKALDILRRDNCQLLKLWVMRSTETPTINNREIKLKLMGILEEPMREFFQNPALQSCLAECTKPLNGSSNMWDLPFLLIIDEAAYLYQSHYMHSFMWVLDSPVVELLTYFSSMGLPAVSRFFVLMLGTHSQISHFAPHHNFPSERYFERKQHIPTVFLSTDWDSGIKKLIRTESHRFEESSHIASLVQWGRPLWLSVYDGGRSRHLENFPQAVKDSADLGRYVKLAIQKLLAPGKARLDTEQHGLTVFAVLAIRLHLNLDFLYPSRASKLVSSKFRWLVDIDPRRKYIVTTYGSEPMLAEAAAAIMNGYRLVMRAHPPQHPLEEFLKSLFEQFNQGNVNRGENGELTARLLCICPLF